MATRSSLQSQWTLKKFAALCQAIAASPYRPQCIREYLHDPAEGAIILRHDIDRFPGNAVALARVEKELGLSSTFYIRTLPSVLSLDVVRQIHALGHEVGYHYETLARSKGDRIAALELFAEELAALREVVPIHTAAMHGSPLSEWNNLDIWECADPADFDLIGEPYLAIDYSKVAYYTDTGRSWAARQTNLRDRARDARDAFPRVRTTDELIGVIGNGACPSLCVQTHPERWNPPGMGWLRSIALDFAANRTKAVIRLSRPR